MAALMRGKGQRRGKNRRFLLLELSINQRKSKVAFKVSR